MGITHRDQTSPSAPEGARIAGDRECLKKASGFDKEHGPFMPDPGWTAPPQRRG